MEFEGKQMICPRCGGSDMKLHSYFKGKRRAKCMTCGKHPYAEKCIKGQKVKHKVVEETITHVEEHRLKKQVAEGKNKVRTLLHELDSANNVISNLTELSKLKVEPPKWVTTPRNVEFEATPTLFLSDTHFDEVVNPAEVNFVNKYNREIATRRLYQFFSNGSDLIRRSGAQIPGVVLALGGDMVSGGIHDELAETNDAGIMETIAYWTGVLASGIQSLHDAFGKMYIPCVTGNHGRNSLKVRAKGRAEDNFDWLIYRMLAWHFESNPDITFNIPLNSDARWKLYETRYQMTHGDQFRGGNGIGGISVPIMRGDARKRNRESATNTPYDILIMGHFHQLKDLGSIIINGSLKGLDEYAMAGNFGFELPQQAFWLTEPGKGKTMFAPIRVSDGEEDLIKTPESAFI